VSKLSAVALVDTTEIRDDDARINTAVSTSVNWLVPTDAVAGVNSS